MKFLLQILLFFFTWFNLSATPAFSKVALPNHTVFFHKTTNQNQESEVKIGVSNFARNGISENSLAQKSVLRESSVLENRAREGNVNVVSGAGSLVRGITKSDFIGTVGDFANGAKAQVADQAWTLWKNEDWGALENLFKTNNINVKWPPNRGFIEYTVEPLTVGKEIDRYGGYIDNADGLFKDNGLCASPKGASFESRALPADYLTTKPYKKYKVVKEIPNVKKGAAAPWFNQTGMGTQYELPLGIDKLINEGYIIHIN